MTEHLLEQTAQKAREASLALAVLPIAARNTALEMMATAVDARREEILAANRLDLDAADTLVKAGKMTEASAKRLDLGGAKLDGIIESLRNVAALPDPINHVQKATELDEGLVLQRISCPIGVIAMIFEARPDALPQIASLCLKSGNAILLKGGSEALRSNRALARVLDEAARSVQDIPRGWITLLETREEIAEILKLDRDIDLVIPRGSNAFVRHVMENTKIPVIGHAEGICHTYIHAAADPEKAARIAVDAKCQYPAVCNATETLLFDRRAAEKMLVPVLEALADKGVELRIDSAARALINKAEKSKLKAANLPEATEEDWTTEYLDLILSVRVVDGLDEAIAHINHYGSHHTDAIVTEDAAAAEAFLRRADSGAVFHNASTRFADGYRFGLGAEIGISTKKIHSRGPVGLEGLTIYKYVLRGRGQTVADYSGEEGRKFTHKPLPADPD